jgi:SAM-dependent methyltransferase
MSPDGETGTRGERPGSIPSGQRTKGEESGTPGIIEPRNCSPVSTKLAADALVVDTSWSPDQIAHFQREIASREGPSGYYHQYTIRDRSGQTLRTIGPHPAVRVLASLDRFGFPKDFTGKTVLDIGCNSGFYSFAAKLRGARSVLGVDYFQHCVDQALLMREILQVDVDFRQGDGETLRQGLGPFDIVINTGVIYHLQNPMQLLSNMAALTGDFMFLESEMLIDPTYSDYAWFIEGQYCADASNWWLYGPNCAVKMARAAGFSRAEFKGFVWTPPRRQKTPEGLLRQGRGIVHCWK